MTPAAERVVYAMRLALERLERLERYARDYHTKDALLARELHGLAETLDALALRCVAFASSPSAALAPPTHDTNERPTQ